METLPELPMDAPIAGQSLTAEVRNRPWQNPPQYSTVEQAIEYYMPKLLDPKLAPDILQVIELGIPITTIANSLQLGGVMQGLHSIDVGVLVLPVLVELMIKMADDAEIEYNTGMEVKDLNMPTEGDIALASKKVKTKTGEKEIEPMPPVAEKNPVMGLMSRGVQ